MPDLGINFCGVRSPNPFWLASGPPTNTAYQVMRAFEEKFPGVVILEGYGLSETASTTTFNINAEQRRMLSIGKPIWGVEVKVVGQDGAELPPATITSAKSSFVATTS